MMIFYKKQKQFSVGFYRSWEFNVSSQRNSKEKLLRKNSSKASVQHFHRPQSQKCPIPTLSLPYVVSSVAVNKWTVMYNAPCYYPAENRAGPIWILWTEAQEKKAASFHGWHVLLLHSHERLHGLQLPHSRLLSRTSTLSLIFWWPPSLSNVGMVRRCPVLPLSQFWHAIY